MAGFVHLHLHSEYSLLDGACRISEIPLAAKRNGHDAVALTDHGVMYGAVEFYNACRKEGVRPIIGCEVYVAARSRFEKVHERDAKSAHLVLLCENETGYRNLIKMVSLGFTEGFYSKPRVDLDLLRTYHEGLIALSACLAGSIPQAIISGEYGEADRLACEYRDIFGPDRFFLEIQDHGLSDERLVCRTLAEMSERLGIGLVATNDAHYIEKKDADTHAILLCIQTNNVITDGRPIGFETDEFYYKSTDEMRKLFAEYPQAIENTQRIADRCHFDFDFSKTFLPRYPVPNGQTSGDYLRMLAEDGLRARIEDGTLAPDDAHPESEYRERLSYELGVIGTMGYNDYFLIVWDYVHFAKSRGIPVGPGRGSGAGSLVSFLLRITDIDPIRFALLFERFLNPERVSMPDIDMDFCYNRRGEVVDYVTNRYGSDHVAQITTFGTMAARAAVRDVGRALGMPYGDVDAVAKLIPRDKDITLAEAKKLPEIRELAESDDRITRLLSVASAIEGMPRHASTHAAGVVITDLPISDYVPLSVNGDVPVTQYDMDTIAKLGLLKFDFLALRYLTIIADAEREIRRSDPGFSVEKIPYDDAETYRQITAGQTLGVFQLESGGMRQMLQNLAPERLEDIIAAIALYRPGPMDSIPRYIECRHGRQKVHYVTPLLAPILDDTYGCIVYQEQVMQIFREVAGYSFGRADIVRRAMSKKKAAELEKERETFLSGAAERGVAKQDAEALFDEMSSFAQYAFNKSHAAAYAVLTYRTAYLSTHYSREYLAALLTSVLESPPTIAGYIAECSRRKIRVLPPDVNESNRDFTVVGGNIRFGLLAIRNVGGQFVDGIIRERENGPFRSFEDFCERMSSGEMNRRQIEALIKCGAFDSLGVYRSRLLASYEQILDSLSDRSRFNVAGQMDLFSQAMSPAQGTATAPAFVYPELPEFSFREKLNLEKESAGLYFSGRILDDYSRHLAGLNATPIAELVGTDEGTDGEETEEMSRNADRDGQKVTVAGVITARTNKTTKKGDPMAFLTLEDGSASIEVIVFPKVLELYTELLLTDSAVCLTGTVQIREEEDAKILLIGAIPLLDNATYVPVTKAAGHTSSPVRGTPEAEAAPKPQTAGAPGGHTLYLRVANREGKPYRKAENLIRIFSGTVPVRFYCTDEGKYYQAGGLLADAGPYLLGELRELLGADNVILK